MTAPDRRPAGPVRARWLGERALEHRRSTVSALLRRAVDRWFASNNSPDAFVMMVVIERGDARMSDEEAIAYVRDQLAMKEASAQARITRNPR